jgi:replicative DNA helicase
MPPDDYFEPSSFDRSMSRIPPHDLDAEAMVISACILSAEDFALVADKLEARHFYGESFRWIYTAIVELTKAGTPVDVVSIVGWLRDHERAAQVGGSAYLVQIVDSVPAVAHVEEKAKRVVAFARARELIATAQRIAAEGYGVRGDAVEMYLDESERAVCEISQQNEAREMAPMSVVCEESYQRTLKAELRQGEVELPTGLVRLDKKIGGLGRGRLTVVAARPGMGKSALATGAADTVAQVGGLVALFSLEMPREELGTRMACARSGACVHRAGNGWMLADERASFFRAHGELASLPIWIDDTPGITLMQLRAKCRMVSVKAKKPLDLVVVDYLQLMTESAPTREREIAIITSGLKRLAKELSCAVLLLSQLNRECEAEKDKRPRLGHLRESGAIEQDADDVIFVYRDEYYHEATEDKGIAELIVAKQRNGPTGVVRVGFDGPATAFRNLHVNDYPDER